MNLARVFTIVLPAFAAHTFAAPQESITFTSVPSNGVLNSPSNSVRTNLFTGGYPLGRIDFSGSLTSTNQYTWRTDSRVLVTAPGGQTAVVRPFASGTTYSTAAFSGSLFMPVGTTAAGLWSFRFFEVIDDGGAAVDAQMTITVTLTDDPHAPPAATDLGNLLSPGVTVAATSVPAAGFRWYRFNLLRDLAAAPGRFLDIDTFGSIVQGNASIGLLPDDTEIALFNDQGALIASDDDSCSSLISQLSFGQGSRPPTGDGSAYAGQNGSLGVGTYYLVVGPFNLTYPGTPWGVETANPRSGNIPVRITTNVPAGSDCFAPAVTSHPGDVSINTGQPAVLAAAASGSGPITYTWRRAGADLTNGLTVNGSIISGAASPTLVISNAQPGDSGAYDVRLTNACGLVFSDSASLTVANPCGDADFDNDGDTGTDADIEAFFLCLGGNCQPEWESVDFDHDGDTGTDQDIEAFFRVLGGGTC